MTQRKHEYRFRSLDLAVEFCQKVKLLKLPIHLRDQMLRASSSVALNLAEGSGKPSAKDKRRFYSIALGSLRECQAILRVEGIEDLKLLDLADHLGASIYKLILAT
ncbi:MAG: four helix bundle protein [Bdellovibrionaceae bacterium]|nr:four helix bundle protein [Bdellovibrionales bacterium]MCB9084049.1 four helix bundle protein [Pseudobdellovibrionaceae bacterium]